MTTPLTRIAAVLLGVAFLSVGTASAEAATDAGSYGAHVAACAQLVGFDGTHNPGMHKGITGWGPDHVCNH
ncbi:hypothetical protein L1785_11950 [Antribacter sp. KLBMP9083]|uniref:Uncharacterized protein n=1 Tax=Antribacter soli TaxID=2910976 RepID=A0AA41U7S5_9MICO|nr:hypothetical protein [Antribacter soli]MCF4121695.1 hypothetical protein [Antribacter soli]